MPHGLGFVPHGTSDVTVLHVPLGSSPPLPPLPPAPPLLDEAPPVPATPPVALAMPPVLTGALAPLLGVPPPAAGPPPIATGFVTSSRSASSGAHAESVAQTTNAVVPGKRAPRATDARFIDALLQGPRTAFAKKDVGAVRAYE